MSKIENLVGQKFNMLTVIERGEDYISPKGEKSVRWWCKCDCGNPELKLILAHKLKGGKTKSCGCLNKDPSIKHSVKKYNTYNLNDEYGVGYTEKGEEFYFDLEDYDKIKNYCWAINDSGYVVSRYKEKIVRMHRIIMNVKNRDIIVDHINHIKNDNRKKNLRVGTSSNNNMNRVPLFEDKEPGVTWDKQTCKWRAYITVNYKKIDLGRFVNYEDAIAVRKKAEEQYFGEWSYDNSIAM